MLKTACLFSDQFWIWQLSRWMHDGSFLASLLLMLRDYYCRVEASHLRSLVLCSHALCHPHWKGPPVSFWSTPLSLLVRKKIVNFVVTSRFVKIKLLTTSPSLYIKCYLKTKTNLFQQFGWLQNTFPKWDHFLYTFRFCGF